MPSFTKVAMLDGPVNAPIGGYTLSGDILVAVFPTHEIWVWNFVQNAWAKWHGGSSRDHECVGLRPLFLDCDTMNKKHTLRDQVLVNSSYLFLAENYSPRSRPRAHCRLFKIQDLIQYPRDTHPVNIPSVSALASIVNDFLSAFQYRGDVLEDISPVSNWRVSSPGDPIFLTRRTIHSDANTLLQILVIKVDMDGDVPSVSCTPSQVPCINPDAAQCQITFSSESLTNCILLRNNANIRVCTQHVSNLLSMHGIRETDESVGPHIIGEVAENIPMLGWMLGFSPAAGRISLSPDDPGYEVHVWDFV